MEQVDCPKCKGKYAVFNGYVSYNDRQKECYIRYIEYICVDCGETFERRG